MIHGEDGRTGGRGGRTAPPSLLSLHSIGFATFLSLCWNKQQQQQQKNKLKDACSVSKYATPASPCAATMASPSSVRPFFLHSAFVPCLSSARRAAIAAATATATATAFPLKKRNVSVSASAPAAADNACDLKARVGEAVAARRSKLADFRKRHGNAPLGTVTADMLLGGMRGVKGLLWEASVLDPEEGIRYRNLTLPDLLAKLPRYKASSSGAPCTEPMAEGALYLLLTGTVPTQKQAMALASDLKKRRAKLPDHVAKLIDACPKDMHPMTQFSIGVLALQRDSVFAKAYVDGVSKHNLWEPALEDSLNLVARVPLVAARIYKNVYGKVNNNSNSNEESGLDLAGDFASRLGVTADPCFKDLMRLYVTIHADHEGGNVSAHTSHLVGSALADPYLAFSAALNGLAGPLHGLANQEVLRWLKNLQATENLTSTAKTNTSELETKIEQFVERTLAEGKVVPGYGHAVLRKTDPRYTCQREFALRNLPDDELFKLVSALYNVVPKVLARKEKIKNPWPNVDAHSGVLLHHYGLKQDDFYTVLFGVSRAIGCVTGFVWSRALGLPIERPKSFSLEALENEIKNPSAAE